MISLIEVHIHPSCNFIQFSQLRWIAIIHKDNRSYSIVLIKTQLTLSIDGVPRYTTLY